MERRALGNEMRNTVLCVDGYENREMCGRMYNPFLGDELIFESMMEFLITLESLLDEMSFPQQFSARRIFSDVSYDMRKTSESCRENNGKIATFHIAVLFRQNSSWQGTVTWMETGKQDGFRSALELLFLMDSALQSSMKK